MSVLSGHEKCFGQSQRHTRGAYTCMYVCMYTCMYVCVYVRNAFVFLVMRNVLDSHRGAYTCMYVCIHVCMYVCM